MIRLARKMDSTIRRSTKVLLCKNSYFLLVDVFALSVGCMVGFECTDTSRPGRCILGRSFHFLAFFKKLRLVLSRRDISEEKPAPPVIFCKFQI